MEVLHKLGIDWKLLIAQGVNFLVLLYLLKRFAYAPMLKFLDDREERINAGLVNAEAATEKLKETEAEQKRILAEAQREARSILEEASVAAKKRDGETIEKTKQEVAKILAASEISIKAEKEKMLREAKEELALLVVAATEKVLTKKVSATEDKELIEKSLAT